MSECLRTLEKWKVLHWAWGNKQKQTKNIELHHVSQSWYLSWRLYKIYWVVYINVTFNTKRYFSFLLTLPFFLLLFGLRHFFLPFLHMNIPRERRKKCNERRRKGIIRYLKINHTLSSIVNWLYQVEVEEEKEGESTSEGTCERKRKIEEIRCSPSLNGSKKLIMRQHWSKRNVTKKQKARMLRTSASDKPLFKEKGEKSFFAFAALETAQHKATSQRNWNTMELQFRKMTKVPIEVLLIYYNHSSWTGAP